MVDSRLWSAEEWVLYRWADGDVLKSGLSLSAAKSESTAETMIFPAYSVEEGGLSDSEGLRIATSLLGERAEERRSQTDWQLHFEPVYIHNSNPVSWTFMAPCQEWQEEGSFPGALICTIDRWDGSVWSEDDYERFAMLQRTAD